MTIETRDTQGGRGLTVLALAMLLTLFVLHHDFRFLNATISLGIHFEGHLIKIFFRVFDFLFVS